MGTEENKHVARRFLEDVINRGHVGMVNDFIAADFVDHQAPPGVPPNREGLKGWLTGFRTAFPDLHYTLNDAIAEGDRVVQYATGRGTMKGEFQGMPPSGKTANWEEVHISRFAHGKVVEHWGV